MEKKKRELTKLNPKQLTMAAYIAGGMKHEKASIKAGYKESKWSRSNTSRMCADPRFKAEIKRLQELAQAESIISIIHAKSILSDIATSEFGDRAVKIRAIAQLGKMSGWTEENIKITLKHDVAEMTDEELTEILRGDA